MPDEETREDRSQRRVDPAMRTDGVYSDPSESPAAKEIRGGGRIVSPFFDPRKGTNPAERASLEAAMRNTWPYAGEYSQDRIWLWNCGWVTRQELDQAYEGWRRGDPIGYMKDQAPDFSLPDYAGDQYEVMVPDTLEVQDRAELAVNAMTELTDPDADFEIYSDAQLDTTPPVMHHNGAIRLVPKWNEALYGCRLVSGSRQNMEVERTWQEAMFRMQGQDGLLYWGAEGRPWLKLTRGGMGFAIPDSGFVAIPFDIGRYVKNCGAYFQMTGAEVWKQTGERIIEGLQNAALDMGSYAYFPKWQYDIGEKSTPDMIDGPYCPHIGGSGWVLDGLAEFYRVTGFGLARELGAKIAAHLKCELPAFENTHFHTNAHSAVALIDFGVSVADDELIAFAQDHFEKLMVWGDVELGYFPECLGPIFNYRGAETCVVSGMIMAGLKLSRTGRYDYWDDVETWIRNQFAESQFTYTDFIPFLNYREYGNYAPRSRSGGMPTYYDRRFMDHQDLARRFRGYIGSNPTPNDLVGTFQSEVGCCTGNGNRVWYYIWDNILSEKDGHVKINLLLNRGARSVDVNSHLPYRGQIDVHAKQPVTRLQLRLPGWVRTDDVCLQVGGQARRFSPEGRYVDVGELKPGQVATLTFHIQEKRDIRWIQGDHYNIAKRGYEVVEIDPLGPAWPMYQRMHYRTDNTRWRKITRFVPNRTI